MSEDLTTLDLVELIELLEPAPQPVPVTMWPQTTGWLWVGVLVLCLAVLVISHRLRSYRSSAYRRAALRELATCKDDPEHIARIVRRVAMVSYGRSRVASLFGDAWLQFLDQSIGGNEFCQGAGRPLASAAYRPTVASDQLVVLVADWIRRHRTAS